MRRTVSQATLLKKRVKQVQGRAELAGVIYLLGTIAFAALFIGMCFTTGTWLDTASAVLGWQAFYTPIVELVMGGSQAFAAVTFDQLVLLVRALLIAMAILTAVVGALRGFSKLGLLFKQRASYVSGFNRNMYAMDDIAKYFSRTFGVFMVVQVLLFLLSGEGIPAQYMPFLIIAGGGVAIQLLAGLIGATATLFTTGERIEEEVRPNGLLVHFIRAIIQIAAVAAIVYFLMPESVLLAKCKELIGFLQTNSFAELDYITLIPAAFELLAWIFVIVLIRQAFSATEFNRDGMFAAGIQVFPVCALFVALALAGIVVLPMTGLLGEATQAINQNLAIAAGVAFAAFLLCLIIRARESREEIIDTDDVESESYFQGGENRYNNTII